MSHWYVAILSLRVCLLLYFYQINVSTSIWLLPIIIRSTCSASSQSLSLIRNSESDGWFLFIYSFIFFSFYLFSEAALGFNNKIIYIDLSLILFSGILAWFLTSTTIVYRSKGLQWWTRMSRFWLNCPYPGWISQDVDLGALSLHCQRMLRALRPQI